MRAADSREADHLTGDGPVPVLQVAAGQWDPVALETWREALSGLIQPEVPHELLGLWAYHETQGAMGLMTEAVLLGPPELAQDSLEIPVPDPDLSRDSMARLERRVSQAGYGSAVCLPIVHGERCIGLALVAALAADQFSEDRVSFLKDVLDTMAPTLVRAGHTMPDGNVPEDGEPIYYRRRFEAGRALHELQELFTSLGEALDAGDIPALLSAQVSSALSSMLPHDKIELITRMEGPVTAYRFGRHRKGYPFADPELSLSSEAFDPAVFEPDGVLVVSDVAEDCPAGAWPCRQGQEELRSIVGVRLGREDSPIGWLLLGAAGPGLFSRDDARLLQQAAPLVASGVQDIMRGAELVSLRKNLAVLRQMPSHLGRLAELLATTAHSGAATRLFAQEAGVLLPFSSIEFALRATDDGQVVIFTPGETRPLRNLPLQEVHGTERGRVLQSEIAHALAAATAQNRGGGDQPSAALIVPLRVAGRVIGTMTLAATGEDSFNQADVPLAQQLADVIAPHLELVRRSAFASVGGAGWRRVGR